MRTAVSTLMLALAANLSAAGPVAPAQEFNWVQGQLAYLSQQNSACMKDSPGFGLGGGQWFMPRWGWEATFLHGRLEPTSRLWKANEDHLDATALFRPLLDTGRWIPFLRAGVGASRLQNPLSLSGATTTRLNLLAAAGTQVILSPRALGTLELRTTTVESSTRRQELAALVGLGYRWGGKAPAAPAPVVAPAPESKPTPAPVPPPTAPEPVVVPPPAPAPAPAAPPPPPVPEPVPAPLPVKFVLGDAVLHFANNGSELSPEGMEAVQAVARQLQAYPGAYTLMVSGHTSSLGGNAHNQALSKRRAEAVARLLAGAGIPADRIFTVGRGPDVPIADNKTREGQSRNRRVEIDVKTTEAVERVHKATGIVDLPVQPKAPAKAGKARPKPQPKH
ncbi:MAG: OmpA family protein [Geothrix sp.]|uniref:OmpA family protein n=1 Tax=Geothrix sp. TaxID=1962974 RepID=UPI0017E5BD66|nr:OmpA family protein [Geothrix sp.]NWJ40415.1 OmpA family protein [Geothrix sp.]WIL21578.1 MAG: OmpA family protein [Geothrix sp.]